MARQKQSFFGKIMGGNVAEPETVEKVYVEQDYYDEGSPVGVNVANPADEEEGYEEEEEGADEELDEGEDYSDEEEADEDGEEYEEAPEEPPVKPAAVSTPISKQDEDWMTDYEGALNIDMYQTKDNVIIKSTIAGVRPDDIDITVANDMVTIQGSRSREEKIHDDDYFYQECYWGGFSRSVIVPVDIDSEHIRSRSQRRYSYHNHSKSR
ncbi:Hsp20/alpha crystallin family protein [bacterium]|nr:MAG: Hsp20/alpha crystallin family protein [bacterium]